jgi:S1-C subfamily serine protease
VIVLLALAVLVPGDDAAAALARRLQKIRAEVSRSVVAIEVDRETDPDGRGARGPVAAHEDYYNRPKGPTSGVIYESDGFILTSYFNVSGGLKKDGIRVTLWNGKEVPGELLGFDEQRDIALLKIAEKGLPVLPKADLSKLTQGHFLALVGRSPDRENPTINLGILSALNRMNKTAVQTDAEMNYGNAGGALVTLTGELVGVACQIKPKTPWGQSGGVGFACKVAEIDALLPRLKMKEHIAAEKRPFLGIRPGEGNPEVEGIQVAEVIKDSPAEKAGVKKDDVLVELDGVKLTDFESLKDALSEKKVNDEVVLKLKRKLKKGYEDKEFKLRLGGAPDQP